MKESIQKVKYFILVCAVICLSTLLTISYKTDSYVTASSVTDDAYSDSDSEASVDPFGYFNGRWNLWEYVGDFVSSFIE